MERPTRISTKDLGGLTLYRVLRYVGLSMTTSKQSPRLSIPLFLIIGEHPLEEHPCDSTCNDARSKDHRR